MAQPQRSGEILECAINSVKCGPVRGSRGNAYNLRNARMAK
jgi:hypothetical protein